MLQEEKRAGYLLTQFLTLADFDSPSNGDKSSSAHLSKQKRIWLGEDLVVIYYCYSTSQAHCLLHSLFKLCQESGE